MNTRISYTRMTRFGSLNVSANKFLTLFVAGKKRREKFMFRRNKVCRDGLYYGKLNWLRVDGRSGILNARFGFGGGGRRAGEYYVHRTRFEQKKKRAPGIYGTPKTVSWTFFYFFHFITRKYYLLRVCYAHTHTRITYSTRTVWPFYNFHILNISRAHFS